jgi:hypothetical protein
MSADPTGRRLSFSVRVLAAFIMAFAIARVFTTLYPEVVIVHGGFHLHHFWLGIVLMIAGSWTLFAYNDERMRGIAATLIGAGGGLVGDEIGLLAFGNYQAAITYTIIIGFTASASLAILIARYSRVISRNFKDFAGSNASLYVGVFLIAASAAFIEETNDFRLNIASGLLTLTGVIILLGYLVQKIKPRK